MTEAPASATRHEFGRLRDGRAVAAVTLAGGGVTATVIAHGATLQALHLPGRDGRAADVVLGFDDAAGYAADTQYFGATVGRYANRLAGGRFVLDGQTWRTPANNGPNALHGGAVGFDKALWEVVDSGGGDAAHVTLRHVSPAGDQGYPGTLTAFATYTLAADRLTLAYRATTDAPTIVNLSNHSYWNLAGGGSAMDHLLSVAADTYLPVDATLIPTGARTPVAATAFDFRSPHPVGARVRDPDPQLAAGRGYDHNFIVGEAAGGPPRRVARLTDPGSGRGFELWSDQPGLQVYSGNFLDAGIAGKGGRRYRQGDAVALEPQLFPDTPNRPAFGSARLAPGETYRNVIEYRFLTPR